MLSRNSSDQLELFPGYLGDRDYDAIVKILNLKGTEK